MPGREFWMGGAQQAFSFCTTSCRSASRFDFRPVVDRLKLTAALPAQADFAEEGCEAMLICRLRGSKFFKKIRVQGGLRSGADCRCFFFRHRKRAVR
jgi:hypothetical protein